MSGSHLKEVRSERSLPYKDLKNNPDLSVLPSCCHEGLLILMMYRMDVLPEASVPMPLPVHVAIGCIRDHHAEGKVHLKDCFSRIVGVSQNSGYHFGGPNYKDHPILRNYLFELGNLFAHNAERL